MKRTYKKSILDLEKQKDTSNSVKRHLCDEPMWKKTLKGKLLRLLKNNLILCESKFNPLVIINNKLLTYNRALLRV